MKGIIQLDDLSPLWKNGIIKVCENLYSIFGPIYIYLAVIPYHYKYKLGINNYYKEIKEILKKIDEIGLKFIILQHGFRHTLLEDLLKFDIKLRLEGKKLLEKYIGEVYGYIPPNWKIRYKNVRKLIKYYKFVGLKDVIILENEKITPINNIYISVGEIPYPIDFVYTLRNLELDKNSINRFNIHPQHNFSYFLKRLDKIDFIRLL